MTLKAGELARIAAGTLEHYEQRADDFWRGTRDHDVSQNIGELLRHLVMRSRGIEMTLVNGEVTWEKGALTGTAAGLVLRS